MSELRWRFHQAPHSARRDAGKVPGHDETHIQTSRLHDMNVRDIFDSMDYGPAPEDASEAKAWIKRHDSKFGQFIDGA